MMPPEVLEYLSVRDADDKPSFVIAEDAEGYRWYCNKVGGRWTGKRGEDPILGDVAYPLRSQFRWNSTHSRRRL